MKTKILLVDPDVEDRESLRSLLERHHYEVITASTIDDGLAKSRWVHLAILELHFGTHTPKDYDGEKLAIALQEQQIPIIFYTRNIILDDYRRLLASRGGKSLSMEVVTKDEGPQRALDATQTIIKNLRLDCPAIVHISDLHFEPKEVSVPYNQEKSRKELINDLIELNLQRRILSLVITGDISRMCLEGSYDAAEDFLFDLSQQLNIPKKHIILTPGNHDVNRFKALEEKKNLDYRAAKGVVTKDSSILFKKFDDFLKFSMKFYNEPSFEPDKLWRSYKFADSNLVIVALNSSLREGDPKYRCSTCSKEHYYGWLGEIQIKGANREMESYDKDVFRIAAFHHHALPREIKLGDTSCFADCLWDYQYSSEDAKNRLADANFKILLHGHQHKARLSSDIKDPNHHIFGSGTLLIRDTDEPSTSVWDNKYLILDLSNRQDESFVYTRKYDPTIGRGKWVSDGEPSKVTLPGTILRYK